MEACMGKSSRGRGWGLIAGIVATALVIVAGGVAQAKPNDRHAKGPHGCVPGEPTGAPGIGDEYYPNYGNGGYDVAQYDLDVAYDPANDHLDGKATIAATATQSVCSFNFDLVGLDIRKIKVDGKKARWTRDEHELTVTPKRSLERGNDFEVVVRYGGLPSEFTIPGLPIRTGFMATPEGATVAGQPEVAAGWFPVNDHPLDKAAYDFEVTVPQPYEVAANGFLRDVDEHGNRTTWEWEASEPMASYLATIDIGFWDVTTGTTADGLPVYDAVSSNITGGLRDQIDSSLARQGEILGVLSDAFGAYPFSTVGAIIPNQDDLRFALETQTRPVYSKLFWLDDGVPVNGDGVVVHELAHQWYGDDVAVARWKDIWLNEGPATYAEWLWAEHEGQATPQEIFEATYDAIPADDPFWLVEVADPGVENLFDNQSYVRGAMTLQALRNEVGDGSFFAIMREWAASKSGGNGTTEEFMALAEDVSGQQLDDLFDVWLFTASKPPPSAVQPSAAGRAVRPTIAQPAREYAEGWLADVQERLRLGRY
ncbi:MAG: M1 family peptidase [Solirubrobacterales bacterium]|nr:M1 family peptidase [Solirubrobacterales bacterium]